MDVQAQMELLLVEVQRLQRAVEEEKQLNDQRAELFTQVIDRVLEADTKRQKECDRDGDIYVTYWSAFTMLSFLLLSMFGIVVLIRAY